MAPPPDIGNSLQDALLQRVRELTSEHGARKALAGILGISATKLSGYLAVPPTRRPNGEMTLLLQDWVNKRASEIQQK